MNSSQILLVKPARSICCDSKDNINSCHRGLFAAVVSDSLVDEWLRVHYVRVGPDLNKFLLYFSGVGDISFYAPPRFLWGGLIMLNLFFLLGFLREDELYCDVCIELTHFCCLLQL